MDDTLPSLAELIDAMNEHPGNWVFATLLTIAAICFIKTWYHAIATRTFAFTVAGLVTPCVILLTTVVTIYVGMRIFAFEDRNTAQVDPFIKLTTFWCVPFSIMGAYTFLLMVADKWNAVFNRSNRNTGQPDAFRVPEKVLHRCEFLGGSFGSFLAQLLLRHKVSKRSYQFTFWAIVSAQLSIFLMVAIGFTQWWYWSVACVVPASISLELARCFWVCRESLDAAG